MSNTDPQVDAFFDRPGAWRPELAQLRALVLECGLTEALKWGQPCYTHHGANVVILGGFKEYCGLLFFKGALLDDPHGLLVRPTAETQAGRQIRFTSVEAITELAPVLRRYLLDAIRVEQAGLKVALKPIEERPVPEELQRRLDGQPELACAFRALTPGRQRRYLLYIADAKQAQTREARVDKCVPRILAGQGLDD